MHKAATLHHKILGEGEPVIILHGLFGMLDNWKSMAKILAQHYMVYLIDLRDHGRSEHMNELSYPLMAMDVAHFMEENWIYEASLIGHSMGGKVAMQIMHDYSDFIDKAIIVDIAPKNYPSGHQAIFDALFSLDLSEVQTRNEVQASLAKQIDDPSVIQFLMKNLSRLKTGGFAWKMNLENIYKHYDVILKNIALTDPISIPSLFVRGARSTYIQDNDEALLSQYFEDFSLKTIDDAGHWIHADKPKELYDHIYEFLT